jgi:hypothetical protein
MRNFNKTCLILSALVLISTTKISAQINFTYQSQYKYLKGSLAAGLSSNWMTSAFNVTSWPSGNAPFRYFDGVGGTELTDMKTPGAEYSTVYLRSTFTATNISSINTITFNVDYDDGFVLWINGTEVTRRNAPHTLAYDTFASGLHESGTGEVISLDRSSVNLVEGINTIAVQCFDISFASSDFYYDMSINAVTNTPVTTDTVGVIFSQASGFYSSPFSLTITSPDPTANVIYTLDGSNPQTSVTSITGTATAVVNIDPASTVGSRGKTPAVVVRASIVKSGNSPSIPKARSFIFTNVVKDQKYPGGQWPNYNVNNQILYYKMDSIVVNDSRYKDKIDDALLAIPTISIVTDMANLFDPATGIYVNAYGHGQDWEKECSAELINPDGSAGFNIEAGLRIRGGWSRHENYPKHAFRLFFRSEYGKAKLEYPLFGDEGSDKYDAIDLRCEENYSYANGDGRNTCVRDVFSRDTQRDMVQPYTRSRYYHLYIDGMYWGLYQTQERAEASYAADYLGGKKDDYDVMKVSTENWTYTVEATDGNSTSWQNIYNMCTTGFADNANYFKLLGKDANGKSDGSEILVNIDNLIDYMLVIFYTGNFDSPTSSFGGNKGCNNYNAIDDRTNKVDGFTFYVHDAEHAMFSDQASPGIGLNEDRVNIGTRTDNMTMEVANFNVFHPQWLHFKLSANAEYRKRFADRAFKALSGQGALTPTVVRTRLDKRVSEIETAIIAESARWGGISPWGGIPYTKDDNWAPEIAKIRNNFFPYRTNIVIAQLEQAGLYTDIIPPNVKKGSTTIQTEKYVFSTGFNVNLTNPNTTGDIYYTLDGTDPRLVGDAVSGNAVKLVAGTALPINSTTILNTRVYQDGSWSALNHINFMLQTEDYTNLKTTELMYHPLDYIAGTDTTSDDDYEFIEFKNIGESAINLSGLKLDSAVTYDFPDNTVLGPKNFYVVASKPSRFYDRYGLVASGNFHGHFSNAGEYVLLSDPSGDPIIGFTYDDNSPWPDKADGEGYSMVSYIYNPTASGPYDPIYWRPSKLINGSPFKDDDGVSDVEPAVFLSLSSLLIYPNPTSEYIIVHINSDDLISTTGIKLFNVNGMLVYQGNISNGSRINFKELGLSAGIFIIQVETNATLETAKVIYTPK